MRVGFTFDNFAMRIPDFAEPAYVAKFCLVSNEPIFMELVLLVPKTSLRSEYPTSYFKQPALALSGEKQTTTQ